MSRSRGARRPRLGLALAGGGPVGGVYEIGALCALQDGLEGIELADLDIYVGVSSGAFIAATLANRIPPAELQRIFVENDSPEYPVTPDIFLKPAFGEYARRMAALPWLFAASCVEWMRRPFAGDALEAFARLSRALPTGVFDNENVRDFLAGLFSGHGRTDDFRHLRSRLFLVAVDLDTGDAVEFGGEGYEQVPISKAVQASSALPGLYPPVRIGERYYVDGALRKTLHASVALREGADLVICINPLIPFDAALAAERGHPKHDKLAQGGLPVVLSQTFRSLIYSRMQVGMAQYDTNYAHAHVVLFQPGRDDSEMFFTNVFSYANRHRVFEHAYWHTREDLIARRDELAPVLGRYGIRIRDDALPIAGTAAPAWPQTNLSETLARLQAWLDSRASAQS